MKILGIDTSTDVLGVAVTDDRALISEIRSNIKRAHAERLVPTIQNVLSNLGMRPNDLNGIAISIGPGSFTGLRIGLAAVKGIALATQTPVVSVVSLDVLAINARFWQQQICPLIKAQMDEAYIAKYRFIDNQLIKHGDYQLMNLNELEQYIENQTLLINSGIKNFENYIPDHLKSQVMIAPPELSLTSGYATALLGWEKLRQGEFEDIDQLVPFYLKDFKAKKKVGL